MRVDRLRRALPVIIGLALFIAALEVLRVNLRTVSWHALSADIFSTPLSRLGLALALTAVNYAALTGYDLLAFVYIGKRRPYRQIAVVSFLAYAIANNVGFVMLSGASVRYRFYTRWGLTPGDLSRIVVSYSVTFWLGLLALGGVSLMATSVPNVRRDLLVTLGAALASLPMLYVVVAATRRAPLRVKSFELPVPGFRLALAQLVLSAIDWMLAGAVLYVLLPPSALTFVPFLGLFFVAILLGMISQLPGGIGVFEGLMVWLLAPYLSSGQLLPALIVFRAVYYLFPLSIALVALVADEAWQRRAGVARVSVVVGRMTEQIAPKLLAAFTFLAGVILLFSGATPAVPARLARIGAVLPLGVIEASHFFASVIGAALLLLSQGLARRLDAAYYLTAVALIGGMAASLLKGFDYEEAGLLLVMLLILWRARQAFDRRAAFFETRFSPGWTAALLGTVAASVWLGFFAYRHVTYSHELWWQFELHGEASRFLRASVGAVLVLGLFAFARLVGPAPHETPTPTDADLDDATRIIGTQPSTFPFLALLRDKTLLFNEARTAFVMYGVQGRTWVALGDPVGPEDEASHLIRSFLERCDDFAGVPVFYEISRTHLHRYADFGLTCLKLGEEAIVDLTTFTLEGAGHAAKYRKLLNRLEKDGGAFRVIDAAAVPSVIDQLRAVSDDWLSQHAASEKGFSLGFFDEAYVARFPVAVIERGNRIQAFANLWPGAGHDEMSTDMMRYHQDAPRDAMEALFVHAMRWGREQGYRRFGLGMAPLSGFEITPHTSWWNRLASFLYEHGTPVYNFQGLRAYKEKFDPVWEPRYLAYPGGLRLPRILADVSALVAGGYGRIFLK